MEANDDLVNQAKRGLKDCFKADREGDFEDLLLTIGAVYRIPHVYWDAYDKTGSFALHTIYCEADPKGHSTALNPSWPVSDAARKIAYSVVLRKTDTDYGDSPSIILRDT